MLVRWTRFSAPSGFAVFFFPTKCWNDEKLGQRASLGANASVPASLVLAAALFLRSFLMVLSEAGA